MLLEILGERAGALDQLILLRGDDHVVLAEADAGLEGVAEAERHDGIGKQHRVLLAAVAVDGIDDVADFLLGEEPVDGCKWHLEAAGQRFADQHAPRCGDEPLQIAFAGFVGLRNASLDAGVERDGLGGQRLVHFGHAGESRQPLALAAVGKFHIFRRLFLPLHREIIEPEHHVLRRHDDRLAVGGAEDVVGAHHQHPGFQLGFQAERHMDRHLVTVEVGIEGRADQRVQLDRLAFDQHRLERLDAEPVKRRRPVQQNRVLADHFVQYVPDLFPLLFDIFLRLFQGHGEALGVEAGVDERLEQLERHLLRQAALVQLQFRTRHDD